MAGRYSPAAFTSGYIRPPALLPCHFHAPMNRSARPFSLALAALMLLWAALAPAWAQSGGKAPEVYRCVNERGEAYFQVGECPKSALIYREAASAPRDGTPRRDVTPGRDVAPTTPGLVEAVPGVNGLPAGGAPALGPDREEQLRRRASLKMLRTFMFGLVFGVVAKFRDRSFFVWFLIGVAVEFALVGAAVFN